MKIGFRAFYAPWIHLEYEKDRDVALILVLSLYQHILGHKKDDFLIRKTVLRNTIGLPLKP